MIRFLRSYLMGLWSDWSERLRGEALVVLLSRIATIGAGTVFVLLTARHLGPAGRGDIAVAFTLAWATTSFSDLGTSTSGRISLLRLNSEVGVTDVLSLTFALVPLQVVSAVVAVTAVSSVSMGFSPQFSAAIVALSAATMLYNSATFILYGLRRYRDVLITDFGLGVFQVVVLVGLLAVGRLTTTSAVAAMAAGPALGAAVLMRGSGAFRCRTPGRLTQHWRGLITDGLSPMVGTVAMFFALRLDRLVLAIAVGSHSLGLFTVALAVPEALRVLPKAFGQVIADRGRSGIDSVDTARRHCRLAVAGHCAVLAVAASLGWLLLPAVFGEGFSGARDVLVVVTLAEAMLSVHLMDQALLVGFGRPYGIGIPQVVGAVVTIALDLIMIPKWGMQGAAWACLFGYSALALTSTIWTNHELRRSGSG
mgnify:FL=1|jgi:O-antigen/teichoic acid export membrane protein